MNRHFSFTVYTIDLIFQELRLFNFKNFQDVRLPLSPGFHFITGKNGAGKTNFLDAIYYLSMVRSIRKTKDNDLIHYGEDFFRLEAKILESSKLNSLDIKFKRGGTKEIFWDQMKVEKLVDHISKVPVVMIAPDEIYQFTHEQEERRKFLNQTLIQTDSDYFESLSSYMRLLKQRNAALKQMKKVGRMDSTLLDSYDHIMIVNNQQIHQKRKQLLDELKPIQEQYSFKICGFNEQTEFQYVSKGSENFEEAILKSRELDFLLGTTQTGIHKDKLECLINGRPVAQVGSQGQIKTLVLSLKLAQLEYLKRSTLKSPIVLLDDIFAKLDSTRVEKLLLLLNGEKIQQCFITDTHLSRVQNLALDLNERSFFYKVEENQLIKDA